MSIRVEIAGVGIVLAGPELVLEAMRNRLAAFESGTPRGDDVRIEMAAIHYEFEPDLRLDQELRIEATLGGGRIALRGAAEGVYDPAARRGFLEAPRNLGEVDGLIRLALSLELPRHGGLLLHAATVIPHGRQRALVLAGASGAGKSTAAQALGTMLCDELSALYPGHVVGTPYWNGRPLQTTPEAVVLLERGGSARESLTGARAVALLATQVIRYVADDALDRDVLLVCAEVCRQTPIVRIACPEGAAFLPHLRAALELAGPLREAAGPPREAGGGSR